MQLHNKLSSKERSKILDKTKEKRIILSFYKYVFISNPGVIRDKLFLFWDSINILGRIYIANEGINAQLSVPKSNFEKFKLHLQKFVLFQDVKLNIAHKHEIKSFLKLKIKVKNKIVADGIDNHDFDPSKTGKHLDANDFNNLMNDKNTLVLDMRNHYESEIGHFKGAICPDVDTFRDSLEIIEKNLKYKKNKNLLMYCTGGIRCEKASAYFKFKGFKNVFQLEGGIINYIRQVKEDNLENKFIGKNFVFDSRMSENVSDEVIAECHQCGTPFDTHTNCANDACHLLFIQCDSCKKIMSNCCSISCKEINDMPLKKQKRLRKGKKAINGIFKKGRTNHILKIIE